MQKRTSKRSARSRAFDSIANLLRKLDANEINPKVRASQEIVAECNLFLKLHPHFIDSILAIVFPNAVPKDAAFYNRFPQIEHRLGHNEQTYHLIGTLWAHFAGRLHPSDQLTFLEALPPTNSNTLFAVLPALPTFLSQCALRPQLLASWLLFVINRLGTQTATGSFWIGLKALVEAFPNNALGALRLIAAKADTPNAAHVSSTLLGHLRRVISGNRAFTALLNRLRLDPQLERRLIFHRSWITLGLSRTLTEDEFSKAVLGISVSTKEEANEAFNLLVTLLPIESTSNANLILGFEWIHKNATILNSATVTHHLIVLARRIHKRWRLLAVRQESFPLTNLILTSPMLQDLPDCTWHEIANLLEYLIQNDSDLFRIFLFGLTQKTRGATIKHFRTRDCFGDLINAMTQSNVIQDIVAEALFSNDNAIRQLGFSLFDVLGLVTIPQNYLSTLSDDQIAIGLYSFRLQAFYGDVIPRFLLALQARIINGVNDLQKIFLEEALYQCINWPGFCLKRLKESTKPTELIKRAVTEAELYFEALRPCFNSAINAMQIPGLSRAYRMKAVRQNRQMRSQVEKNSILTHLASKSYTLYGGVKWQTYFGGVLGDISEMKEFSHSVEFPRLPGIDPEGAAIRLYQAQRIVLDFSERTSKEGL